MNLRPVTGSTSLVACLACARRLPPLPPFLQEGGVSIGGDPGIDTRGISKGKITPSNNHRNSDSNSNSNSSSNIDGSGSEKEKPQLVNILDKQFEFDYAFHPVVEQEKV